MVDIGRRRLVPAAVVALVGTAWLSPAQPVQADSTTRASLTSSGGEMHNPPSPLFPFLDPSLSADGRYVTFATGATDLVPADTNGLEDIFVRDRRTGETTRVSVATGGAQAGAGSLQPSISSNGRFVAFKSYATNLVAGDDNGMPDVFVRDLSLGTTERVSLRADGSDAGAPADETWEPRISADGSVVVFRTDADDLVAGDTNNTYDVFAADRVAHTIQRVSTTSAGTGLALESLHPDVSAEGRYVVFESGAQFAAADGDGDGDVFLKDRVSGVTSLMSSDGAGQNTTGAAGRATISDDGRIVAFESASTLLVNPDANGTLTDIFLKDRVSGQISLVSRNSLGAQAAGGGSLAASIDETGRRVTFESDATNLVAPDPATRDVYLRDIATGTTERISVDSGGGSSAFWSILPSVNATGRYVVFQTAGKLESGDTNDQDDVYVRDTGDNRPPVAAFEVSMPTPDSILVDAAASADPDGWLVAYHYTFGDSGEATGPTGPHRYTASGSYSVTLTVTDQDGATATTVRPVTVVVAPPPAPPGPGVPDPVAIVPPPVGPPLPAPRPSILRPATPERPDSRNRVAVRVRCLAAAGVTARCAGRLALSRPATRSRKALALGSRSFSIAPGRTATIRVPLSVSARRLLARSGRIAATATVSVGGRRVVSRSLVLAKPRSTSRSR